MSRKNKVFLILAAVLLATDIGLVLLSTVTAREALMAAMQDRATALREGFNIALYSTELKLMEIATFVSQIDEVKGQLAAAETALAAAGPDTAEPQEVERVRRVLLDIVGPRWNQLRFRYLLRQLTFYTPPEETVLLRADMPYVSGDRAMRADSLASRAAESRRPVTGFDIDRRSVGVRAAVPVIDGRLIGVVEVGTAFDTMLIPICPNSRCGATILLDARQTEARMAPDAFAATFTEDRRVDDFLIEASTNPSITRALIHAGTLARSVDQTADLVQVGDRWLATVSFPLLDHLAKDDPSRGRSGAIVAWLDVDEAVAQFQHSQMVNIGFAILAFVAVLALIRLLIEIGTTRLEREIAKRTAEVESLLAQVSHLASRDFLTDLHNRRAFTERLEAEIARVSRHGGTFGYVAIDLDHFKQINDTYGHPAGDEVLKRVADIIRATLRANDVAARVGGEEFALLLPDTPEDRAADVAERLRRAVAEMEVTAPDGSAIRPKLSAGIVGWSPARDEETLLRLADAALYRAKDMGRNRVIRADQIA